MTNGWLSVEEAMPFKNGRYLVTVCEPEETCLDTDGTVYTTEERLYTTTAKFYHAVSLDGPWYEWSDILMPDSGLDRLEESTNSGKYYHIVGWRPMDAPMEVHAEPKKEKHLYRVALNLQASGWAYVLAPDRDSAANAVTFNTERLKDSFKNSGIPDTDIEFDSFDTVDLFCSSARLLRKRKKNNTKN